jgi:hypothetical protein
MIRILSRHYVDTNKRAESLFFLCQMLKQFSHNFTSLGESFLNVKIVDLIVQTGEERQVKGNSTMASSEPNINLHIPQDVLDKMSDYLQNANGRVQRINVQSIFSLSRWLTEYFFKSPKKKALEDAYKFLQLNSDASVDEINTNFRRLAINEYNPNIVGSNDNFKKLQYYMSIIKLHKGEF